MSAITGVRGNEGHMAGKATGPKPLSHYVAHSLDGFFGTLNGHAPKDLYGMILEQVEPPLLRATMKYCGGNQSRAASILGLNRATLRKKLRQHKIKDQPSVRG